MDKINIEECFLITKEDYVNMSLDKKKFFIPKENKIIFRVLGIIAVCCGVTAFINIRESIYQIICWFILIIIGLYVLSYYDVIYPVNIQRKASRFYDYNDKILKNAFTLNISDNDFKITSEIYKICVPKKYLYKIIEGNNTFMFFIDSNEFLFIPKRALNTDEIMQIKKFAGDKYIKL